MLLAEDISVGTALLSANMGTFVGRHDSVCLGPGLAPLNVALLPLEFPGLDPGQFAINDTMLDSKVLVDLILGEARGGRLRRKADSKSEESEGDEQMLEFHISFVKITVLFVF